MKNYFFGILTLACFFNGLLCGYTQNESLDSAQINPSFNFKYDDLKQKKDEFKNEMNFKNPIFTFSNPNVKGEVSLKGIFNLILKYKENHLESNSDGSIHLFFDSNDASSPTDVTIDGPLKGSMDGDLAKIKRFLSELKTEEISVQQIIDFLASIKAASFEGQNLKWTNKYLPDTNSLIDFLNIGFQQTNSSTPEEINAKFKIKQGSSFLGYSGIFKYPKEAKIVTEGEIKLKLSSWEKIAAFLNYQEFKSIPEGSVDMKMLGKSSLGEGLSEFTLNSTLKDMIHSIDNKIHYDVKLVSDWVEQVQGLKREAFGDQNETYSFVENYIYQWVISPKTTPFLKLLPLQFAFDWNGILVLTAASPIEKGVIDFSLIGKINSGLKVNVIYEKEKVEGKIIVLGGRPTFDQGVELFNSFSNSISSVWPLPKISQEGNNKLYALLAKYSDLPEKANEELKLTFKTSSEGNFTIGSRPFSEFQNAISSLIEEIVFSR